MYGHQKQGIMTLEEAQKEVDRWIKTYGVRSVSYTHLTLPTIRLV